MDEVDDGDEIFFFLFACGKLFSFLLFTTLCTLKSQAKLTVCLAKIHFSAEKKQREFLAVIYLFILLFCVCMSSSKKENEEKSVGMMN